MKGLDKNMPIELVKQGFSQAIERLLLGLLKTELSTQLLRDVPQRSFFYNKQYSPFPGFCIKRRESLRMGNV